MNRIRPRTTAPTDRPSRGGWWALLGGLLGMLVVVIGFAPASWLASVLSTQTNGQVQLLDSRGTIWNGSAQLTLTGGSGSRDQTVLPGRLQWQLRPAWAGFSAAVLPDCCAEQPLQAQIQFGWQKAQLNLADHQSYWPSSLLQGLGSPWNTLQLDGELSVRFINYQLQWVAGRSLMQGELQTGLKNATSRLTTIRPMGSYRFIMRGGDTVTVDLVTDSGPLMLSGKGQWQGQRLRFNGEASATPEHLPALSNLLTLMGRRVGDRAILTF